MGKSDKNGPTVSELSEINRWRPVIKLGRLALWNALTKKVVDLKSPTIGLIEKFDPDMFQEMIKSPRPVAMGDATA